jgi:hypothetical protein
MYYGTELNNASDSNGIVKQPNDQINNNLIKKSQLHGQFVSENLRTLMLMIGRLTGFFVDLFGENCSDPHDKIGGTQ